MERRVTRSSSRSSPPSAPSSSGSTTRNWRRTRTPEKLGQGLQDSDKENAPPANTTTATEETCGICLDNVKEKGELNCCMHAFCFECIFQWSKTSNTCPLCKARFVSLRKLEQGKPRRGKSYKVQDVDHRQDDSDFDGWISSEDDDYIDEWEDLDSGQDDFWMYNGGGFFNHPYFIDLTEGDSEDDEDVQVDEEEEEDEDASDGEEEGGASESDESGADSDCYIIETVSDEEEEEEEVEEVEAVEELAPRRSTRLHPTEAPQTPALRDVEMDDSESVGARVAQRHRPLTERQRSLRSANSSNRNPRATNNTPTTRARRTRTTTAATTTPSPRRTRRESDEGTGLRKSARLASRMDVD